MANLKSLAFTAMPKTDGNPALARRLHMVERLEEQIALINDPTHTRLTQRWVKQGDDRVPVEKRQRVKPWWRTDVSGQIVMTVRFGSKPIEFEKGKAGIAVPSKDKLVAVIETLISAVRNGELDDLLTQASKQRVPQKTRKVA